mgnify:CR=1 FL=1
MRRTSSSRSSRTPARAPTASPSRAARRGRWSSPARSSPAPCRSTRAPRGCRSRLTLSSAVSSAPVLSPMRSMRITSGGKRFEVLERRGQVLALGDLLAGGLQRLLDRLVADDLLAAADRVEHRDARRVHHGEARGEARQDDLAQDRPDERHAAACSSRSRTRPPGCAGSRTSARPRRRTARR